MNRLPFLQLTDFGLAKFYHSISRVSKRSSEEEGGTLSYMPPEAFDLQYSPTRASDIYRCSVTGFHVCLDCAAVSDEGV